MRHSYNSSFVFDYNCSVSLSSWVISHAIVHWVLQYHKNTEPRLPTSPPPHLTSPLPSKEKKGEGEEEEEGEMRRLLAGLANPVTTLIC